MTEIRIGESKDPAHFVRAIGTLFLPSPYAPGSPKQGHRVVAPVGRCIKAGDLVPITDPAVRAAPEYFETVSRPITVADIDAAEVALREIERRAS